MKRIKTFEESRFQKAFRKLPTIDDIKKEFPDEEYEIDEYEITLRNNVIEAARQYIERYGKEDLLELLNSLKPY